MSIGGRPAVFDPTPVQIAERCAEIQATWTVEERAKRLRGRMKDRSEPEELTAPIYSERELGLTPGWGG